MIALRKYGFKIFPCFLHTLNLLNSDVIYKEILFKPLLEKICLIIKFFKKSPLNTNKLIELQKEYLGNFLHCLLYIKENRNDKYFIKASDIIKNIPKVEISEIDEECKFNNYDNIIQVDINNSEYEFEFEDFEEDEDEEEDDDYEYLDSQTQTIDNNYDDIEIPYFSEPRYLKKPLKIISFLKIRWNSLFKSLDRIAYLYYFI